MNTNNLKQVPFFEDWQSLLMNPENPDFLKFVVIAAVKTMEAKSLELKDLN